MISAIEQKQELRVFDGALKAAPAAGGGFNLTITWGLSAKLAAGGIRSYVDDTGATRYNVFIGIALNEGDTPSFVEATLNPGGRFQAEFANILDGAWKIDFYYVTPEDTVVAAARQTVPALAGLDNRLQRIELAFSDLDTSDKTLRFRYRRVVGRKNPIRY